MMDFSGSAGAASSNDLLPKGMVAWAVLTVRGVKASAAGGAYLDCELTIDDGQPYARKKLWDMIGDPNHAGNSEKYREMGTIAITRILEAGRGAGPNNKAGYAINAYSDLDGLRVAIKVGVEAGTNGHADKNRVAEYLTPNPASQSGHKGFLRLQEGKHLPDGNASTTMAVQSGFSNFGGNGASTATPAATPAVAGGFGGFGASGGAPAAQSGFPQAGTTAPNADAQQQAAASAQMSPSDPAATPGWLAQAGNQ